MKRKLTFLFLILGLLQAALFCQKEQCAVCPPLKTLNTNFEELLLTAWNTAGLNFEKVTDTAYKHAFGLQLEVEFASSSVGYWKPFGCGSNFNMLFAGSRCPSCFEYVLLNGDPYDSLRILVTDVQTRTSRNITTSFRYQDQPLITLVDYLAKDTVTILSKSSIRESDTSYKHHGFDFYLDLVDFKTIPNAASFTVELFLRSGQKLSVKTEQIIFHRDSQSL